LAAARPPPETALARVGWAHRADRPVAAPPRPPAAGGGGSGDMDPLQQPQARLADDKAQPLHNLTGAARRRSSGPLPSLGAPMASPS
jgi:hypothetical protein